MKRHWPLWLWFALGVLLPAVLVTGREVAPTLAVFALAGVGHAILALTCVGKAGSLLIAAITSSFNARAFEHGNPARRSWTLLALAFLAFFLGQSCYAPYQIVLGVESPFPSIADVFWLAGYPLVVVSLASFDRMYAEAGLNPEPPARRWGIVMFGVLLCAAVGWLLLLPVARAPAPALKKAINLAYPILDLALLGVSGALVRTTLPLRQGRVGRTWMWMLGGFLAASLGDVAFSYLGQNNLDSMGPVVDVLLLCAYGAMARAALTQRSLEGEEESG
jgi:hypothetical protein